MMSTFVRPEAHVAERSADLRLTTPLGHAHAPLGHHSALALVSGAAAPANPATDRKPDTAPPPSGVRPSTNRGRPSRHRAEGAASDAELVLRAQRGEAQAFAAIYRRYSRYVAAIAKRMYCAPQDLDDVVQDTFVQTARGLRTLQDPNFLKGWLAKIAVRCTMLQRRERQRTDGVVQQISLHTPRNGDPAQLGRVEELGDVLERLPKKLQMPWLLVRLRGERLEDAAVACGVSLATLKRRVAAAESSVERRLRER